MGGNPYEFFIIVEEMPAAKEMQITNMFNKLMAIIQTQSKQSSDAT